MAFLYARAALSATAATKTVAASFARAHKYALRQQTKKNIRICLDSHAMHFYLLGLRGRDSINALMKAQQMAWADIIKEMK